MQHLDRAEFKRLLNSVPDTRNRLMILVTFWHGLRNTEATGIRGWQIQDGHLFVKRLKGSEPTTQPFVRHDDPDLDEATPLLELAKTIGPDELVFPMTRFGYYKLMRRAGKKAGIPEYKHVRPHILKHSIACQTIKAAGIEMVRQRLGHKSIASTGHYLKVSDDEAAQAIELAMR